MKRGNNGGIVVNTMMRILTATLLFVVLSDCSEDDPKPAPIQIGETSIFSSKAASCDSGPGYDTILKTNFNADSTITIKTLIVTALLARGPQQVKYDKASFNVTAGVLTWRGCFGFPSSGSIDLELQTVGENGETSNTKKYTLNKP